MNRKLKALGLTIAAVTAMTAFTASATALEFHTEVAHTEFSGETVAFNGTIKVNAGTISCPQETFSGTSAVATTSEITVAPTFINCTAFGFVSAQIDFNQCDFKFTPLSHSYLHIICGLSPITVTAFNCWVTIGSQTVNTGVTYWNEGSGVTRDLRINLNLSGLTYTQHSKSFPGCTNGTFTNGAYEDAITLQGVSTIGTRIGVWRA
jgi:hypothetical protein